MHGMSHVAKNLKDGEGEPTYGGDLTLAREAGNFPDLSFQWRKIAQKADKTSQLNCLSKLKKYASCQNARNMESNCKILQSKTMVRFQIKMNKLDI
jgi:hypothetical protein